MPLIFYPLTTLVSDKVQSNLGFTKLCNIEKINVANCRITLVHGHRAVSAVLYGVLFRGAPHISDEVSYLQTASDSSV